MDIISALKDEKLFGHAFKDHDTWAAWHTVIKSIFGLPMSPEDLERFREPTGREVPNPEGYEESWLVVGRRGGKSRCMAAVATYLGCFVDWTPHLAPGETGVVMVIAQDRRSARVILDYVKAFLLESPMLADLIEGETQESVILRGRISIEVHTASFRSIRGRTVVCGICDELAYWREEGTANPDIEILNALRPAMSTVPGAKLLCASSPFARRGALWGAYETHFGQEDAAPLVWQATTRQMNPTVRQSVIDKRMAEDEPSARAEYLAEFRRELEAFVKIETVAECTGTYTARPFDSAHKYYGFVDPSGGSEDAFTLAISHREGDSIYVDAVFAKHPPFSPTNVAEEFARLLQTYRIGYITGDRYGGEFPRELFRRHGVEYRISPKTKSELYQNLLPLLNSNRVVLPKSDLLVKELVGLQRRVSAAGKETIDHGKRKTDHDDVANACAGAAQLCSEANRTPMAVYGRYGTPDGPPIHQSKFDGPVPELGPTAYATSR
jgi:hypothetical protein